jgi:methylphosphotriester-DNA--protein-cysteine methyltransferase
LFHKWFGHSPCTFGAQALALSQMRPHDRSFSTLIRWATDHARAFEDRHAWPPAVRAARLLQKVSTSAWYVPEVARAVHVSSPTLERGFRKVCGMSVQQYQSLVHLRTVTSRLREDGGAIEGVIVDLGYRSSKDVYGRFGG